VIPNADSTSRAHESAVVPVLQGCEVFSVPRVRERNGAAVSYVDQRPCEIYVLSDPHTGEPRYVGRSRNAKRRLYDHIDKARRNTLTAHNYRWIRSLLARGVWPLVTVVEVCAADDWADRERFWIAHYRAQGARLTNHHEGGYGPWDVHPETRALLSAATARRNRARKGLPSTAAQRQAWRDRQRRIVANLTPEELHLYAGRMVAKRKPGWNRLQRTHCPHGHEYTPANTYVRKRNAVKVCLVCSREKRRKVAV
jgi:hypothetical protein